jgi:hypothetical protein
MGSRPSDVRITGRVARAAAWLAVIVICLVASRSEPSAQAPCDPALPRNDAQSTGYRPRGDRCEGVYKRPVASFGVQLVSFTAQSDLNDLCTGDPVHMIWPSPATRLTGAGSIHILAESLRQQLYYRLDLDRQIGTSGYEWPPDPRCNNEVRLGVQALGILGRTTATVAGKPVDVLLPVRLARQPNAPVRPPFQALLMPGSRLREVYVSLWRYDGSTPVRVITERPLSMPPYPAGSHVTIPITAAEVPQEGLYRARASVEFAAGEVEAIDFYFLNAR